VQLAARVWKEDSQGLIERTLESEAFRSTGRPTEELYAEARGVAHRMSVGAAFFGAWCGLVVALKFAALKRIKRQESYEIEHSRCMVCGRCFHYCPGERQRLKETAARAATGGFAGVDEAG